MVDNERSIQFTLLNFLLKLEFKPSYHLSLQSWYNATLFAVLLTSYISCPHIFCEVSCCWRHEEEIIIIGWKLSSLWDSSDQISSVHSLCLLWIDPSQLKVSKGPFKSQKARERKFIKTVNASARCLFLWFFVFFCWRKRKGEGLYSFVRN